MKFPIIIKQSPLILIKRIVVVEILIGIILFFLSLSAVNYRELVAATPIINVLRFGVFLILSASLLQLFVTLFTFLTWHNEEYRLKEREIVHRRGVLWAHERSIMLKNISSVEYRRNWLEFLLGYGTIVLWISNHESEKFKIRSVETPEIYANIIKDAIDQAIDQRPLSSKKISILDLVLEGESSSVELKQTFRYDIKSKDVSKYLEKAVMKTVAAFLNAEGGNIIIGVTDQGRIFGLAEDYNTLVRKDRDGFENHFNQVLKTVIGAEFRQYISLSFESIEDKDVCLIEVRPAKRPAYLKTNGDEEFFIRTGNTTSPLKISEVNSYI